MADAAPGVRILFIGMAVCAWVFVAFPDIPVHWKGGNHAPLSRGSKLSGAVAATALCCAVFGFHPQLFVVVFIACALFGVLQSTQDRAAFDASEGVIRKDRRVPTAAEWWPVLCFIDGLIFVLMLYVVVRDARHPAHTDEQYILHIMGIGYLVASGIGAVFLYLKRPQKGSRL